MNAPTWIPDIVPLAVEERARIAGAPLLVVSDIHGDVHALEAVLDATLSINPVAIVALGDHCFGGSAPFEVWQRLHSIGATLLRGPTDMALGALRIAQMSPRSAREEARALMLLRAQQALGDVICRRLAELPTEHTLTLGQYAGITLMHGSPYDEYRGINEDDDILQLCDLCAEEVLVSGGTHRAFVREHQRLTVVNAGSVGQRAQPGLNAARIADCALIWPTHEGRCCAAVLDVVIP